MEKQVEMKRNKILDYPFPLYLFLLYFVFASEGYWLQSHFQIAYDTGHVRRYNGADNDNAVFTKHTYERSGGNAAVVGVVVMLMM